LVVDGAGGREVSEEGGREGGREAAADVDSQKLVHSNTLETHWQYMSNTLATHCCNTLATHCCSKVSTLATH